MHCVRSIQHHDNLFKKLIIPILDDLFGLFVAQNLDKNEKPLDADLKVKLERYHTQMKKAKEGKEFTI